MMRKCSLCNQLKVLEDFCKNKNRPYGRGYYCKVCKNKYNKKFRKSKTNKTRITKPQTNLAKDGYKICNDCKLTLHISNFTKNSNRKDNLCQYCKQCIKNRQKIFELEKRCRRCGKKLEDITYKTCKSCRTLTRLSKYKEYRRKYRQRKKEDPRYRIIKGLRKRVRNIISKRNLIKNQSISKSIGCTPEQLYLHIESQFESGMTWDNYGNKDGQWSIDHIKAFADCITIDEIIKNNHYTNLRPMWHKENMLRYWEEKR